MPGWGIRSRVAAATSCRPAPAGSCGRRRSGRSQGARGPCPDSSTARRSNSLSCCAWHGGPERGGGAASAGRSAGRCRRRATSRSYRSIVIANTFTVFNAILAVFGAADDRLRQPQGRPLPRHPRRQHGDRHRPGGAGQARPRRLAALVAPAATVVRGGTARDVPVDDVVVGDLVRVTARRPGRRRRHAACAREGLALDESNLTGESEPVVRGAGDEVLSGSFAVEGGGDASRRPPSGPTARAAQLAATARSVPPPALAAGARDGPAADHPRRRHAAAGHRARRSRWRCATSARPQAVETLTAAIVNIVPEGLILLVSLTAGGLGGEDGAPRDPRPAAQRDRVARLGLACCAPTRPGR